MKIINTKLHGILDYSSGIVLLLPWITNYSQRSSDTLLLAGVGAAIIFMSLLTDYEFGLIKMIPMRGHLLLDIASALLLIASPWLFPVYNYLLYWPLLFGVFELLVVLLSSHRPYQITGDDLHITRP